MGGRHGVPSVPSPAFAADKFAQALMARKVGEHVAVPTEHGERTVEVVGIEAYKRA